MLWLDKPIIPSPELIHYSPPLERQIDRKAQLIVEQELQRRRAEQYVHEFRLSGVKVGQGDPDTAAGSMLSGSADYSV